MQMKDKTFNDKMMMRPLDDKFEIECLPKSFYRDAETFRIERDLRTTIQKLANYAASGATFGPKSSRQHHFPGQKKKSRSHRSEKFHTLKK